jgi:hypothetical protein
MAGGARPTNSFTSWRGGGHLMFNLTDLSIADFGEMMVR